MKNVRIITASLRPNSNSDALAAPGEIGNHEALQTAREMGRRV